MKTTKSERIAQFFARMEALGFSYDESAALRRIEMTLHRWHEQECGDGNDYASWAIERDETTDIPYRVIYPHNGKTRRKRTPDREKGALKRLQAIVARHKAEYYVQTDPRGCALYVAPDGVGMNDSNYSSRGTAVCY